MKILFVRSHNTIYNLISFYREASLVPNFCFPRVVILHKGFSFFFLCVLYEKKITLYIITRNKKDDTKKFQK